VSVRSISLGAPPKSVTLFGSQSNASLPGSEVVVQPARIRGAMVGAAPANVAIVGAAIVAIATPNAKTARRDVNFMTGILTLSVKFVTLSVVRKSLAEVLTCEAELTVAPGYTPRNIFAGMRLYPWDERNSKFVWRHEMTMPAVHFDVNGRGAMGVGEAQERRIR
jgi:hypothetical protein